MSTPDAARRSPPTRTTTRWGLVVGLVGSMLLLSAVLVVGAEAAVSKPQVRHIKTSRVCPAPTPGHSECMAVRFTSVAAGTPGATPYVQGPTAAGGIGGGFTPQQLATAYGYNPAVGGSGQTIALVDAYNDPNIEADLETFDKQNKLPACTTANGCFKKDNEVGETDEAGWDVETSLDVETAHAVCESCKILLVEAEGSTNDDLEEAEATARGANPTEISNSFGGYEGDVFGFEEPEESGFYDPHAVVVASAGDEGYLGWGFLNTGGGPEGTPAYPAGFADVVSAGGTELTLSSSGTRETEKVWNVNGPSDEHPAEENGHKVAKGVTGGGCATKASAPEWQLHVPDWSETGCGTKRLSADVSAVAGYPGLSIYDSCKTGGCEGKGWQAIGGTSLASPLIAALYGLAGGDGGVEYPASTLYGHFASAPSSFRDITEGGNGYCDATVPCTYPSGSDCSGAAAACDALPGYDGPSGVGSPTGLSDFTPLSVTTRAPGVVTQTSATLKGIVDPHGESVNECTFYYKQGGGSGSVPCKALPGSGNNPVEVAAKVSGLTPGASGSYRVEAGFYSSTIDPGEVGFITPKVAAPAVETKGSAGVGASSATLYASVNPRGGSVSTCKFEYGTSTGYGSSVSCASLPGSGSSPVVVDASIASGLAANTTYHYRISATNSSGTNQGADATFKTS